MKENPFFTVIIPTYNRSALLTAAIDSVRSQSFEDWEVLVVDDESSDDTKAVVERIDDCRIKYLWQPHAERSVARNYGIDQAQGMYICFLDDDDYYLNFHLESLYDRINMVNKKEAIFRTGMIEEANGEKRRTPLYNPEEDGHPIKFFLENMAGIHTLCFHRNILREIRFDHRWFFFEDTHFLVRALHRNSFYQLNVYSVVYRRYSEMGSYKAYFDENAEQLIENNMDAMRDLLIYCDENFPEIVDNGKAMVAAKYLEHAIAANSFGKKKLGRIMYKKFNETHRAWNFPIKCLKYWYYRITG